MVYQVKCAWCGKFMGNKEGAENKLTHKLQDKGIPIVTHSICECCKRKMINEYENIRR